MEFWARFYECEDGGWIAELPAFDALTQGDNLEHARKMAADLLIGEVEHTWARGKSVVDSEPDRRLSGIWERVSLPTPALLTLKRSRVEQGKTMETAAASEDERSERLKRSLDKTNKTYGSAL